MNRGHNHFTKSFCKFSEKHLLKYFTRAPWLQKILQNVLGKVSRNIRNLVRDFLNQYFYNLAQTFLRLREMLHKRSHYHYGEGFWNFSEIFCEWFGWTQTFHEMFWQVCGNIYWNISRKLPVKILETLHTKSCRLFTEKFQEIFRSRSDTVEPIFPQPCRNIYRKITRNVA